MTYKNKIKPFFETAPSKELIPLLIHSASEQQIIEFILNRAQWYGYPLIHVRLHTYSVFDDLFVMLNKYKTNIQPFLIAALKILEHEHDKYFNSTLYYLLMLFDLNDTEMLLKEYHEQILNLKSKAQRLSIVPSLTGFWNHLVFKMKNVSSDIIQINKYFIKQDDYLYHNNHYFKKINEPSPVDELQLKNELNQWDTTQPKCIYSIMVNDYKYWIWLLDISNDKSDFAIIKLDNNGIITIHRISENNAEAFRNKIILQYHYQWL